MDKQETTENADGSDDEKPITSSLDCLPYLNYWYQREYKP